MKMCFDSCEEKIFNIVNSVGLKVPNGKNETKWKWKKKYQDYTQELVTLRNTNVKDVLITIYEYWT